MSDEIILPFATPRAHAPRTTAFRGTWVVSSLQTLRTRGHFERYITIIDEEHRTAILEAVAGTWLALPTARAHYVGCDRLNLRAEEQIAMGAAVGERAQGTILSNAVRAARGAGVTPWTIFPQFERLWRRGALGGAVAVFRTGPKDARAEFIGCELFDITYFRNAFRGVLLGIAGLFCEKAYVTDLSRGGGEGIFRFQWV